MAKDETWHGIPRKDIPKPVDFINVRMDVPTVQGARQKTPSFMSFDVTSTEQEDIQDFLPEVRDLIRRNGLTLVSENKL